MFRHKHNYSIIGARDVFYNNVHLSDLFIIDEILLEILPAMVMTSQHVPSRHGDVLLQADYGTRSGSMRVSMKTGARDRVKSLGIYKEPFDVFMTGEPKKLQLGNFYVWALFTGSSDYDQVGIYGSTTLNFTCFDPYMYYKTQSVSLARGTNGFYCTSPIAVYPTFTITGASPTLTITNSDTGDKVVIPSGFNTSNTVTVDMERERCEVNGNYLPVSNELTDFFTLRPGQNSITLSSGSGTLTYQERRL